MPGDGEDQRNHPSRRSPRIREVVPIAVVSERRSLLQQNERRIVENEYITHKMHEAENNIWKGKAVALLSGAIICSLMMGVFSFDTIMVKLPFKPTIIRFCWVTWFACSCVAWGCDFARAYMNYRFPAWCFIWMLHFLPCLFFALTADFAFIGLCVPATSQKNITSTAGHASAVFTYTTHFVDCKHHVNETNSMAAGISNSLTVALSYVNSSYVNSSAYFSVFSDVPEAPEVVKMSQSFLCLMLRLGVPIVFRYLLVHGIMVKQLLHAAENEDNPNWRKKWWDKIMHNTQICVLDMWDLIGFATLAFDATALAMFQRNKQLVVLHCVGSVFALGVWLGCTTWYFRDFDKGRTDEQLKLRARAPTFFSAVLIDGFLLGLRCFFMSHNVTVENLYLLKNLMCLIYKLARTFEPDEAPTDLDDIASGGCAAWCWILKEKLEHFLNMFSGGHGVETTRERITRLEEPTELSERVGWGDLLPTCGAGEPAAEDDVGE